MYGAIVRHVLLPFHERLVGRDTLRFYRTLNESQWFAPSELAAMQCGKLRELLRHAAACVPYYRRRFVEAGVDVRLIDELDALSALPMLSKDDIRAYRSAMVWHQSPGGLFPRSTGGSTGEPVHFFLDRRRQAYDQAARMRSHEWFGARPGDRELYLWGSPIELDVTDRIRSWRDRLMNHRLLSAFDMSPQRMDRYLDDLERYQPVSLFGYPSSIALLARHIRDRARNVRHARLRAVFVTGEVCLAADRRVIHEVFQVPVADGYGSREAGFIAHECPRGSMHITAENVIVEIVSEGLSQPAGVTGEIVVTHLDAWGMPFIRYRTGDIGRLAAGRCECGRGLPRLEVVQGRSTDFIHRPDGTICHGLAVIYPLRELDGIRNFRILQHADFGVEVLFTADSKAGVSADVVASAVRRATGSDLSVRAVAVADIPPLASGKHRYVISNAGDAHVGSVVAGTRVDPAH